MNNKSRKNENKQSIVVENAHSTVMAEYISDTKRAEHYQSEDALEKAFIKQLESQAYEYLKITSEQDLVTNLRTQLEKLNDITFSDKEWEYFLNHELANPNESIEDKTRTIQEDYIKNLTRDDGSVKNIYLLKKIRFMIILFK